MKKLLLFILLFPTLLFAQVPQTQPVIYTSTGTISIGSGVVANSKSLLDLTSTTKGFLMPRMTSTQRDAITSPPNGLQIFNTTTNAPNYYNGSAWTAAGTGTVTSVGFTGGLISVANATTTPALTVAGTSGGITYFSSGSTWATSAELTSTRIVIGGGAGAAPYTSSGLTYSASTLYTPLIDVGTSSSSAGIIYFRNATNSFSQGIRGSVAPANIIYNLPSTEPTAGQVLQSTAPSAGVATLSWSTPSTGITVGTTTITSGTSLRIPYNLSGVYQEQANFTIGSVATGVLDVPVGYASRGVKFANQYDTGLNLTVGYLSGLGATVTNNTFDANTAYNTLVGIGAGSAISGSFAAGNTALGYEALKASGGAGNPEVYSNTAIGFRALGTWGAGAGYNVALGYRAGYGTGSTLRYATFLGYSAGDGSAYNSVIAIGANATPTAANQCIIGATGAAGGNGVVDNVYVNGVTYTSAAGVIINSCGGSGTNNAGGSMTFATRSTGSATPPNILFQTGTTLGSGTTLQTPATRLTVGELRVTAAVPIKLKNYTVATLPTGSQGDIAFVTDALAPTYGATLVGGGSVFTIAFYDGTNWTAH